MRPSHMILRISADVHDWRSVLSSSMTAALQANSIVAKHAEKRVCVWPDIRSPRDPQVPVLMQDLAGLVAGRRAVSL